MTITIGSLSSGYGGLETALVRWLGAAAVDVRWHAEIDPDASLVLKTWWPEVPNLGSFADEDFWERAERVHLMCGGIPCQPFSAAGRQLGEADARHLWPFWRRGIELHRPATIVFENVANLTRGKMRPTFDSIIADLLELGYDVRWCLLGACAVGAAHHRHRVFLLACRTRATPNAVEVKVQTCGQAHAAYVPTPRAQDGAPGSVGGQGLRDASRLEMLPTPRAIDSIRGPVSAERQERTGRIGEELISAVAMLPTPRARDGAVQGETGTELRRREAGRRNGVALSVEVALLPTPNGRDGSGNRGQGTPEAMLRRIEQGHQLNLGDQITLLPTPQHADSDRGSMTMVRGNPTLLGAVQPERWGKYAEAIARHEMVLGRPAPEPTELGPKGGRRLAAAFSEWLMMLPEGHLTSVLPRNPALARAGNGVVPLQAATALRLLFEDLTNIVACH